MKARDAGRRARCRRRVFYSEARGRGALARRGARGCDARTRAMRTIANERDALAATEARAARAILDHRLGIIDDDQRARRAALVAKQFAEREALAIDEELDEPFDLHELYAFLMMPADKVAKAFGMPSGSFRLQYVKAHVSFVALLCF